MKTVNFNRGELCLSSKFATMRHGKNSKPFDQNWEEDIANLATQKQTGYTFTKSLN